MRMSARFQLLFFLGLSTLILFAPATLTAATFLSPSEGDILAAGSVVTVTWSASPGDATCRIEYSMDNGRTWKTIADQYPAEASSYEWSVPVPPDNVPKCLLRLTAYDARGRKHAVARSGRFAIAVVRLIEPNGEYALRSASTKTIRWVTHQTQRPVGAVQLEYSSDGGRSWQEIVVLEENPETYFWFVPEMLNRAPRHAVRVTLKDATGHVVGSDKSDACFRVLASTAPRKTILSNAHIITMEDTGTIDGAICISDGRIQALGPNRTILALADGETDVVNLEGLTVIPGFIDPHTHLLNDAGGQGYSLDAVQWLALTNGITGVGNIGDRPEQIEAYIGYAQDGRMRIRSYHYLCYTDHCGYPCGDWYADYTPGMEYAPNVWVNGIKLFVERSVCPEILPVFSPDLLSAFTGLGLTAWEDSPLFFSTAELAEVIGAADARGHQVAIHAIGDVGLQTTLDAIDLVLAGADNLHRHMVFHNHFLRDDMLGRYAASDILAIVEPARPGQAEYYAEYVGEANMRYFKRWRELTDSGARVAGNSDWPNASLSPIRRLDHLVTDYVPAYSGRGDQALDALEALRQMTIHAAYAMQCDDRLGSLQAGKLADLVVLSANPMEIDPADMQDIRVLMTMVDGWVEFWSGYLNPVPMHGPFPR